MTECENDEMTGDKGSVAEKIPAVEPLFFFRGVLSLYRRGGCNRVCRNRGGTELFPAAGLAVCTRPDIIGLPDGR